MDQPTTSCYPLDFSQNGKRTFKSEPEDEIEQLNLKKVKVEQTEETSQNLHTIVDILDKIRKDGDFYCMLCEKGMGIWRINYRVKHHYMEMHNIEMPDKPQFCLFKDCNQRFGVNQKKELLDHVWAVHLQDGRKVFKENIAKYANGRHYRYLVFLKHILYNISENDVYYCKICDDFEIGEILKLHLEEGHELDKFECPALECSMKFEPDGKIKLMNHFKEVHLNYKIKCRICKMPFESVKERSYHEMTDHGKETYECLIEKNKIDCKVSILHLKYLKQTLQKSYVCKICQVTVEAKELRSHYMRIHAHMDLTVPLVCPIVGCNDIFDLEEYPSLPKHIRQMHLGFDIKCRICDDVFETKELRRGHERTKHDKEEISLIQEEERQDKEEHDNFESILDYLKRYYQSKGEYKVLCKFCDLYIDLDVINLHFENYHFNPFIDECPIGGCNKEFPYEDREKLSGHIKQEHLQYGIKCRKCDEVFDTTKNRYRHEWQKHDRNEIILINEQTTNKECYDSIFGDSCHGNLFLEKFIEANQKKELFYCIHCSEKNMIKINRIEEHFARFHPDLDVQLPCPVENCKIKFHKEFSIDLKKHITLKHLDYKLKCNYCDLIFRNTKLQENHERRVHNQSKKITQTTSSANLVSRTIKQTDVDKERMKFLNNFLLSNAVKNLFFCKFCKDFEISEDTFLEHIKSEHDQSPSECPLDCPVETCNQKFKIADKTALSRHVKIDHMNFYENCRFCDKTFMFDYKARQHEKQIHAINSEYAENPRPDKRMSPNCIQNDMILCFKIYSQNIWPTNEFNCKLCDEMLVKWVDLYAHFKEFHQIKDLDKELACPIENCPATFRNDAKYKLPLHIKALHLGFTFYCSLCDEVFDTEYSRSRHENEKHDHFKVEIKKCVENLEKIPQTVRGNKTFLTRVALAMTKEYAFYCNICKKVKFMANPGDYYRQQHKRKLVRFPQKCPAVGCEAKYRLDQGIELSNHIKSQHLMGFIHKCKDCKILFKTKEDRYKHSMIHRPNNKIKERIERKKQNVKPEIRETLSPENFVHEEIDTMDDDQYNETIIPEIIEDYKTENDLESIVKKESLLTSNKETKLPKVTKTYGKKNKESETNSKGLPVVFIPTSDVGMPNLQIVKQEVQIEDFIEEEY